MTNVISKNSRACLAAVAAGWALAGCGAISVPSLPSIPAPQIGSQAVRIDAERSGKQVDLRLDQELIVRLPTEPQRGYRWLLDTPAEGSVLVSAGPPRFEREGLDTNAFEAAGYEVFRFRPRAAGQQTLRFEYRREGVVDPVPADVAWFLVAVR